jgi:DNA-binding winged helix-turn-helix (wHTH) protein/tetratricopeptide (TPR) repeat protein
VLQATEQEVLVEIKLAGEADLRIGDAWLRPSSRLLEYGDHRQLLEPRVVQLLVALAQRPGQVRSRDELVDLCWGGRIVGEDAVNRCVAKARRDIAGAGLKIETVPKVGYRLLGAGSDAPVQRIARPWLAPSFVALLALAILSFALWTGNRPKPAASTVEVADFAASSTDPVARQRASKISGQIVDALADIGLAARHSSDGHARTSDYVVRGQIDVQPETIRALIQIAESRTGITISSQTLEIDPDEEPLIADKIAAATAGAMSSSAAFVLLSRPVGDPAESAQVLEIASRLTSGNYLGGYAMARQLTKSRPGSAIPPFLLAWASIYALPELAGDERPEALREARLAASLSVKRLPEYGDARIPSCRLYPLNYARCDRIYRQALAIDPSAPTVPLVLALQLMNAGRLKDALPLTEKSAMADPFNPTKVQHRLYATELLGLANEETLIWNYGQRYWPKLRFARQRFVGLMAAGRWREAQALLPALHRIEPDSDRTLAAVFAALSSPNETTKQSLRAACVAQLDSAAFIGCLTGLSMSGLPEEALKVALRQLPAVHSSSRTEAEARFIREGSDPGPLFLLWGAGLKAMRQQPGFAALAERAGLIDYWRTSGGPDFCRTEPAPVCKII